MVGYHYRPGLLPRAGPFAVFGFFFLSGFLVSQLLDTTYHQRPGAFVMNRFLRIFPPYWAALLLGLALASLLPEITATVHPKLFTPTPRELARNVFLWGMRTLKSRPVAVAWSLELEVRWYLFLFATSFFPGKVRVGCWLAVIPLCFWFAHGKIQLFYWGMAGSGLCFALGSLHYYGKPRVPRLLSLAALSGAVAFIFSGPPGSVPVTELPYFQEFLCFQALLFLGFGWLLEVKAEDKASSFAAMLSYPIFLMHRFGLVLTLWFGLPLGKPVGVAAALGITLALSLGLHYLTEVPLRGIRTAIRRNTRWYTRRMLLTE